MSDVDTKIKNSKRRHKTKAKAIRQMNIAKSHGVEVDTDEIHRFAKKHALNCGNPNCMYCSNPRKTFKERSIQEKRMFQDLDTERDRHSNGLHPDL